ncbi:MAG: DUF2851 family protein [Balneolaceae bacterium]|nr:DUF2851 family protein [Balneolaceae bacterium]MBO6544790.1 DUF2851 family protein [Balneolaceae bacterium]MBO6646186.1 DUF2851 family protein [Balneolaceae bacterium]
MPDPNFSYSEDILQWIWEEQFFDLRRLKTSEGSEIQILDPGTLNKTDGPDFLNARIRIDGMLWVGAVELHLQAKGWEQHGHNHDEKYNQVVLHVVADNNPASVRRKDGGKIPTLNLLPFLNENLHHIIENIIGSNGLPCSSGVTFISEDAFQAQIEKANHEYLEKKTNDFLRFYNPYMVPSRAWKEALVLSLFDGFGITHNRVPMVKLGKWFLKQEVAEYSEESLIQMALQFAGFGTKKSDLKWNHKGVFPANHPKMRIPQVVRLAIRVLQTPTELFFDVPALTLWEKWENSAALSGSAKMKMLYGIVFVPAMFSLGSLFGVHAIKHKAVEEWKNLRTVVPSQFTKPFISQQHISPETYSHKLGVVHQVRAYCEPRRCHQCIVLKKVISS